MGTALQHSLFDTGDAIDLGALAPTRTHLDRGAWVDYQPSWLTGADLLFEALLHDVPWKAERREMYERVVDVPRLLRSTSRTSRSPTLPSTQARKALSRRYAGELGEPFVSAGLCLYRDGRDSVAWHGDRDRACQGPGHDGGDPVRRLRPLADAPAARRWPSIGFSLGHGDLVVMGGSCQRTWDHAIPKTSKPVGPRISIQFRPRGIR